ncbi:hypothetical protein NFJ02_02g73810 [Pycnococcus provasolii]
MSATTTSLHDAASSGDLRAFKSILNNAPAGSKILSERNSDGKTPIMLAASNGQYSILDFVFANGLRGKSLLDLQTADGGSALMSAAAHGETEATHVLAKMGADINAADTDGWTALHFAAAAGEPAACQVLVSAGADINKRNKDNDTPPHDCREAWGNGVHPCCAPPGTPRERAGDDGAHEWLGSCLIGSQKGYSCCRAGKR